jgi:Spy/CpxP family protein refolding chaperone
MKRSVLTAFVLAFLAAAAALAAQAAGERGHHAGHLGRMGLEKSGHSAQCFEQLGLTDPQKQAAAQLRQELMTAVQPLIEQRRALHEQIEAALEAANPDPTAIGQLVIAAHRTGANQIRSLHDTFETRFTALLTPEQVATYQSLRSSGVCGPREKHAH